MAKCIKWSAKDEEFLIDKWGVMEIDAIAKKLKRTYLAVMIKAKRLKLGGFYSGNSLSLTATQASKVLNNDRHTVVRWIKNHGLKATQTTFKIKNVWLINFDDLLEWLKDNQHKWDSSKVELYALGKEEEWLKEKRKKDHSNQVKKHYRWTRQEDSIALSMWKLGYTKRQIAERVNRSYEAVVSRLHKLNWATGEYVG